jgi:hypothetical protein
MFRLMLYPRCTIILSLLFNRWLLVLAQYDNAASLTILRLKCSDPTSHVTTHKRGQFPNVTHFDYGLHSATVQ